MGINCCKKAKRCQGTVTSSSTAADVVVVALAAAAASVPQASTAGQITN